MKIKLFIPCLLLAAVTTVASSCQKEKTTCGGADQASSITNPATVNQWIDKYLSEWYLWPCDVAAKTRDYTLDYIPFFESLLSKNRLDGKWTNGSSYFFSYIVREPAISTLARSAPLKNIMGIQFYAAWYDQNHTSVVFIITNVVPGSNADGKLLRGDFISKINDQTITGSNYPAMAQMLESEYATGGTLSTLNLEYQRYSTGVSDYVTSTTTLAPTLALDDPILVHKVITFSGKRIAYLAYNQFITGYPEWTDNTFDNELKNIFRTEFAGVDAVVVDLRYNHGGASSSCLLLSSMLAPASKLNNTIFGTYERNAYVTKHYFNGATDKDYFLSVANMSGQYSDADGVHYPFGNAVGANINKQNVYVIATGNTASSSEMLINGLRGAGVTVYHIGENTVGKSVGMDMIGRGNSKIQYDGVYGGYAYTMWPISLRVKNAKGEYVPDETGFIPTTGAAVDEFAYRREWKPLGDPTEILLSVALSHITTGKFTIPATTRASYAGQFGKLTPAPLPDGRNDGFKVRSIPEIGGK